MNRVQVELSPDGQRIDVWFRYDPRLVEAVKEIPGRRFTKNPRPHWTVPKNLTSARRLREAFGEYLDLGPEVLDWGREAVRTEREIRALSTATDAELEHVPEDAAEWLRPYQRADIAMMARASVLNANQPGVGKTVEVIYATIEAGIPGPHLVVCPTSLFKDPWRDELERHLPEARVMWGSTPTERRGAINWTWTEWRYGRAGDVWLLLNPEMVRVSKHGSDVELPPDAKILSRDHKGNVYVPRDETTGRLFEIEWGIVETDEFHKYGLGADRNTLFARGLAALRKNARRAFATSGTPTGGKPIRLWGVLNFIEPELYSSKWRWAEEWLEISDNGFGKKIGGIVPGREAEFDKAHAKHLVRRTRKEALPGLPDKIVQDVWCEMTRAQTEVYEEFMEFAEVELEGGRLSATGVLAEFTRAKQLANALCSIGPNGVEPTSESGKIPVLLDRLDTFGLRKKEPEPGARAIVASESQRFVELLTEVLSQEGLSVRRLDGTVTGEDRDDVIDWYKEPTSAARVLAMTTQTGGVGLNLGMTGSIHIMDETWNPDDQEQLEDRGMRNRTEPLNVLYYRTTDTIQEYIFKVGFGKKIHNGNILEITKRLREART